MIQARRQIRYSAIALGLSIAALIVSIISAVSVQRTKPEILTELAEEAAELSMNTTQLAVSSIIPAPEPVQTKDPLTGATKLENVTVTHYCICQKCCGKTPDHPAYGITASGKVAEPNVSVAVDPDIIPLGSTVIVDYGDGELHYYRADDTGGAIKGNHIDLCMNSHEEALTAGVRTATVYWVSN